MGIADHLICLFRNLYAGQEATVKTGHGTTDWFQIGKGVRQGCILSPCLFNLYTEYIGLEEAQAGIKIARRNINNLRYADMPPLWQKVKKKRFLMKVKEGSKKSWLKTQYSENQYHGIQSHHVMANRWGNFIFLCSKITADGDCSHEIKRCLLLGRKVMTNLESKLKIRHIIC